MDLNAEDECVLRDGSFWRNGPASLWYDIIGVKSDCNQVDYSVVHERSGERPADGHDSFLLDAAVKSILPDSTGSQGHSSYTNGFRADESAGNVAPQEAIRVWDAAETSIDISDLTDSESSRLRALVVDAEQADAVSSIVKIMTNMKAGDGREDDAGLEGDNIKHDEVVNEEHTLVSQTNWEEDVIWDPSTVEQKFPRPRQLHYAGWIPSRQTPGPTLTVGSDHSMFSSENEELRRGSWMDDILWDADEFVSQYPMPKLPQFDATDEHCFFEVPEDLPKEKADQGAGSSSQNSATNASKKHQPHSLKSKMLLKKAGFIAGHGMNPNLEEELRLKEAKEKRKRAIEKLTAPTKAHTGIISYNISNDEFYNAKEDKTVTTFCSRHSKVVKELRAPFVLNHLSEDHLRHFHRPKLFYSSSPPDPSSDGRYYVKSVAKRILVKHQERQRLISQGRLIIFDEPIDLSAKDGEIVFVENSEEHPPLLSKVGMCSNLVNFYHRKSVKQEEAFPTAPLPHTYGLQTFISTSSYPFLGILPLDQSLSAICNDMYASPIYWHKPKETDFLLIISKRAGLFIRLFDAVFVAGQQCPKIEVPEPNSVKTKVILRDLLLAFLYRKYRQFLEANEGSTPKIRLDLLTSQFPCLTETTIKTMLRDVGEVRKVENTQVFEFRVGHVIPLEPDLQEKVPPELVCAYHSQLAGEQRLRDAEFHSLLTLPERGEEDLDKKKPAKNIVKPDPSGKQLGSQQQTASALTEDLLCAPWNTTSAFLAAKQGKCLLQVIGPADPTGCGEGMSYVRVAKRAAATSSGGNDITADPSSGISGGAGRGRPRKHPLKTGGTDADLRKLSAKTAKELLRKVGVPEKEILKLSRWEIIDVVRTLSTEKVKNGESVDKAVAKYSREKQVNSTAMHQERYKEACQQVFELQNKVLASSEILSSEDEDSDEDDSNSNPSPECPGTSDIERLGKDIESILSGNTDFVQMTHDEEERERLELQKMMLGSIKAKDADVAKKQEEKELEKGKEESKNKNSDVIRDLILNPGKVLKITRTFQDNGESFTRTEIVRDPMIIAAYIRIRNSKSEEFIKNFLQRADKQEKKEKKERERLLHCLQQVSEEVKRPHKVSSGRKRKLDGEDEYFPNKEAQKKCSNRANRIQRKCGACGNIGHMKTSKRCPMYDPDKIDSQPAKRQKTGDASLGASTSKAEQHDGDDDDSVFGSSSSSSEYESSDDDDSVDSSAEKASQDQGKSIACQTRSPLVSPHADAIVKTDGIKLFVNKASIQQYIQQAKDEELQKAKADSAASTPVKPGPKRKTVPREHREQADFSIRPYKTTAADRRMSRL